MKMLLGFLAKRQHHKQLLEHQMTVTVQISKIYQNIKIKEMIIPWINQHNQSIRVTHQRHQRLRFFQGPGRERTFEEIVRICHFFLPNTLVMVPWGGEPHRFHRLLDPWSFAEDFVGDTDTVKHWGIKLGRRFKFMKIHLLGSFFQCGASSKRVQMKSWYDIIYHHIIRYQKIWIVRSQSAGWPLTTEISVRLSSGGTAFGLVDGNTLTKRIEKAYILSLKCCKKEIHRWFCRVVFWSFNNPAFVWTSKIVSYAVILGRVSLEAPDSPRWSSTVTWRIHLATYAIRWCMRTITQPLDTEMPDFCSSEGRWLEVDVDSASKLV